MEGIIRTLAKNKAYVAVSVGGKKFLGSMGGRSLWEKDFYVQDDTTDEFVWFSLTDVIDAWFTSAYKDMGYIKVSKILN